jgi:hypothetical protein
MCLAIWRPVTDGRGSNIANQTIDIAFTRHPDGFGVVTRTDLALKVERFAPNERKAFRKALKRIDASGVEYAAHWRFATSGPIDRDHSHPFVYTDPAGFEVAVLHNGIINIAHDRNSTSDTAAFVWQVLAAMPSRWWEQPAMRFLVAGAIGWSKLIVFPALGETVLINADGGSWDGGIWYSSDHKPAYQSPKATAGPKGGVYAVTPALTKGAGEAYKALTGRAAPALAPTARPSLKVPAVTPETAYLPDKGARNGYPNLRHSGHALTSLVPVTASKDGDYANAVECDSCGTIGHVYAIDGSFYVDIAHREPVDAAIEERVFADALPF